MNDQICLTRLSITGLVDVNTPQIVLKEIADAHNITYNKDDLIQGTNIAKFVNHINIQKAIIVKKPYKINELSCIAHFINKNIQWSKGELEMAFEYLMSFSNYSKLLAPPINFTIGLQTPKDIYTLNSCVLYAICKANNITTNFNSSIEEMANYVKLISTHKNGNIQTKCIIDRELCKTIYDLIRSDQMKTESLINIVSSLNPNIIPNILKISSSDNSITKFNVSYTELARICDIVKRERNRNNNKYNKPTTHTEAIVMAALDFKIDISETINPLAEYKALTIKPYFPYDRKFSDRLYRSEKNPDICDNPHLNIFFNIKFPESMYTSETILQLCRAEGIDKSILDGNNYNTLQVCYLSYTFLHGKHKGITNKTTTYKDDIIDLEDCEIVCYGIRINDTNDISLTAYTYLELANSFDHYRRYQNPLSLNNSRFTKASIDKLKILAKRPKYENESVQLYENRLKLNDAIDRVSIFNQTHNSMIQSFIQKYDTLMESLQFKVRNIFLKLLHLSMYMRGWSGSGPYPILNHETLHNNQCDVDLKVSEGIREYEDACILIPEMSKDINKLPLMIYNNGFIVCSNIDEGLTIFDRIQIIKAGNDTQNMYSCIRLSSNRLAASAYYYMQLLNIAKPFDIESLASIS